MIKRAVIVLVGWVVLTILEAEYPAFMGHGRADYFAGFLLAWALFKPLPKQSTR